MDDFSKQRTDTRVEERNREEEEKWRGHVTKREAYLELRVVAFRLLAIRQFLLHRQQLWLSLRSSVPELHRHGFRLEVLRRIDARQHRASPRWFRDYYFRSIRPRRVAILETRKGILLPPLFLSQLNKILLTLPPFLPTTSPRLRTGKRQRRIAINRVSPFAVPFLPICSSSSGSIFLESTASKITS